jgi:hypothetical protein
MIDIPYDMTIKGVGGTSKIAPPPYIAAVLIFSPAGFFKKAVLIFNSVREVSSWQFSQQPECPERLLDLVIM